MEPLPYEKPRLSVTAMVSGNDFAALLERAIQRSAQVKQIELRAEPEDNDGR